jgi:hypothetical protein
MAVGFAAPPINTSPRTGTQRDPWLGSPHKKGAVADFPCNGRLNSTAALYQPIEGRSFMRRIYYFYSVWLCRDSHSRRSRPLRGRGGRRPGPWKRQHEHHGATPHRRNNRPSVTGIASSSKQARKPGRCGGEAIQFIRLLPLWVVLRTQGRLPWPSQAQVGPRSHMHLTHSYMGGTPELGVSGHVHLGQSAVFEVDGGFLVCNSSKPRDSLRLEELGPGSPGSPV